MEAASKPESKDLMDSTVGSQLLSWW